MCGYSYVATFLLYISTYVQYVCVHVCTYLPYYDNSSKSNEVPSVSNQLAVLGDHDEAGKLTTIFNVPKNEQSTSSFIYDDPEKEVLPPGYAVIDAKEVRQNSINDVNTT